MLTIMRQEVSLLRHLLPGPEVSPVFRTIQTGTLSVFWRPPHEVQVSTWFRNPAGSRLVFGSSSCCGAVRSCGSGGPVNGVPTDLQGSHGRLTGC